MIQIDDKLINRCHEIAEKLGWHKEEHSNEYYVMLIIADLSEAAKASIDNKYASKLNNSKKDQGDSFNIRYNILIEQTVEYKLATVIIRCLDLAALESIDVSSWTDKMIPYSEINNNGKITTFAEFAFNIISAFYESNYSIEECLFCFVISILSYLKEYDLDIFPYLDRNIAEELDAISYKLKCEKDALKFLKND